MGSRKTKFAGWGMHEQYLPTTGKGYSHRRSRKNCKYYSVGNKWCTIIWNYCVGPTICKQYEENGH